MFTPDCADFAIGAPVISVGALAELRELLNLLRPSAACDKAVLRTMPKEGTDEASAETTTRSVKPSASPSRADRTSRRQGQRTRSGADGTSRQSGKHPKRQSARKKGSRE